MDIYSMAKKASLIHKVGFGLTLGTLCQIEDQYEQEKKAADGTEAEVAAAQIDQINLESNPVSKILAEFMMKNPPANLQRLVELCGQKLEQDLQSSLSSHRSVTDPLKSANENLKMMLENMQLKQQIQQMRMEEITGIQNQVQDTFGQAGMAPNPGVAQDVASMQGAAQVPEPTGTMPPGPTPQYPEEGQPGMEPGMEQQGMEPGMEQPGMGQGMEQGMA